MKSFFARKPPGQKSHSTPENRHDKKVILCQKNVMTGNHLTLENRHDRKVILRQKTAQTG